MTQREKDYLMFLGMTAVGCIALLMVLQQVNAYYRELNYEKTQNVVSQLQLEHLRQNNQKIRSDTAIQLEISGWSAYKSTDYGFSFKYPADFTQKQESSERVFFRRTDGQFSVSIDNGKKNWTADKIQKWFESDPGEGGQESSQVTIVGVKIFRALSQYSGIYDDYFVPLPFGVVRFNFEFNFEPENSAVRSEKMEIINKIISTFQSSDTNIAGWKTYENDEYGFEFKYPPDLIAYDIQPDKDKQFVIGFNDRAGRGLTAVIFSKSWDASYIQGIADGGYSNFRMDGQTGYRFTQSMPGTPCKSESVVIPFEKRTLEISFPGCPQRLQVGETQNIIESIKIFSAR